MSVRSVFPTYIYQADLGGRLNRALSDEIYTLSEIDSVGRRWSAKNYVGGYSSYGSLTQLHKTSPHFALLERRLKAHVRKFVKKLRWNLLGRKLTMTTCWVNSMGPATYHTLHTHPLSVLSGVYYVNAPKGSSPLKIEDPRLGFFMNSPPRLSNAPAREQNYLLVRPRAGGLVLFESWMRHEVPPHRGSEPRLSISFNYEL